MISREDVLRSIDEHIARDGWHRTTVLPGPAPGWTYTIGLTETWGLPELVVAGWGLGDADAMGDLLLRGVAALRAGGEAAEVADARLVEVDPAWRRRLMLGADQRYAGRFRALQVVADGPATIDVPDLGRAERPPAWRWVDEEWPHAPAIGAHDTALTDLVALAGGPLHEVARVADGGRAWECWASGEDPIPPEHQRVVPFGVLLAVDPTLADLADLDVGELATRDPGGPWKLWSA